MPNDTLDTLLNQAHDYAREYLASVDDRGVAPTPQTLAALSAFDEPLPATSADPAEILRQLHEVGSPATVAQGGGRYFGFVNGGVLPIGLAARWLADVWDQNAALSVMSPVAAYLENLCERWLTELFNLPEGTAMGLVTGTSAATLVGLAAARDALLKRAGWDVGQLGVFGAPRLRVVTSDVPHSSVGKALRILGFGADGVEHVPSDAQGRLLVGQLPPLDSRTILILGAGNVNTGAFDDFSRLCKLANEAGAWVHVDGAFGLWAGVSPSLAHLTKGVELADSWVMDGHKTLNTPYDCGIVLVKDRAALTDAMAASGAYIQYGAERDGMRYVPDMSRRARGVELWAVLKSLGRQGIAALVEQLHDRAVQFAEELRQINGFEVINDVHFNQVLVKCDVDTQSTLAAIQQSGECWVGGSQWKGDDVIRVSVCSWATTPEDISRSVTAFAAASTLG